MSVVRSAYRQLLKQARKASLKYGNSNELCFAVFGLMLRMDDFAAAGYGKTFQQVAHSLFARPSIEGVPGDEPLARLAASFDVLRRLVELALASRKTATPRADSGDVEHEQPSSSAHMECQSGERGQLGELGSETGHAATAVSPSTLRTTSAGGNSATAGTGERVESNVGEQQGFGSPNDPAATSAADEDDDNGKVSVANGTVFIENSMSRKIRKLSRRVILSRDPKQLPPYRYMLPPEPLYPTNTRVCFSFPLIRDAMLCMAARASCNGPNGAEETWIKRAVSTEQEYRKLCNSIPTRTVTVTDHVEVELRTEHVCTRACDGEDDPDSCNGASLSCPLPSMSSANVAHFPQFEHIFRYFVFIRNYEATRNAKKWHVQLLSRHWVFFDETPGVVVEVVGQVLRVISRF
ncbi:ApaG domain [Trypanosoma vivax]|nr:ApaG domain [Trypanosoma vivax]